MLRPRPLACSCIKSVTKGSALQEAAPLEVPAEA
jgi:hypothetical protein